MTDLTKIRLAPAAERQHATLKANFIYRRVAMLKHHVGAKIARRIAWKEAEKLSRRELIYMLRFGHLAITDRPNDILEA